MKNNILFSLVFAVALFFFSVDTAEAQTKKGDKKDAKKEVKKDDKKDKPNPPKKEGAGNDKAVGKDVEGRTIYEGPRGGRYYLNSSGNKVYVGKDKK
jgi:colicin import membrane protein